MPLNLAAQQTAICRAVASAIGLFAASLPVGEVPANIHLLPAGTFEANDGRDDGRYSITDADGQQLAAALTLRHAAPAPAMLLDYEHQCMLAKDNGKPVVAAGWMRRFEWRAGFGLVALAVEFTAAARAYLAAREILYLSPIFVFEKKTGRVLDLRNAALTNSPGLSMLGDLTAALTRHPLPPTAPELPQEPPMTQSLIALAALSLSATADAAAVDAAVVALKARADTAVAAAATTTEQLTAAQTELAQLKAASTSGTVAMAALQAQVTTLTQTQRAAEVGGIITAALTEGKLLPAQEAWARELGTGNLKALQDFVASAPVFTALTAKQTASATGGTKPAGDAQTIAALARKYMNDQAALGVEINAAQAVKHVTAKAA